MTKDEAKEFLREFLKDRPNFRKEHPGQDEEVYRQMDRLAEAQTYAERLKATIEHCKVTETTTAVVIEWQELAAVTIKQEGQDERTDETG